jgi:ELWxxDGT repeat protein
LTRFAGVARGAALGGLLLLGGCADSGVPDVGEARLVKDLGPGSSKPDGFTTFGDAVLFRTADLRTWRTDGTAAGTIAVMEAGLQAETAGATRFFAGTDVEHGVELWKTDGTAAGTVFVRDINPGPAKSGPSRGSSYPREFTEAAGVVFFVACEPDHGWELWRTDGTEAGTVMVEDIDTRPVTALAGSDGCLDAGWRHQDLREMRGRLYFLGDDGGAGVGLWQSDGTAAGTRLVRGVPRHEPTHPRDTRRSVEHLTRAAGRLFFTTPSTLWSSDGTADGSIALPWVPDGMMAGTPSLFFYLWEGGIGRSDGTVAGTYTLKEMHVPIDIRINGRTTQVASVGERLFFLAGAEAGLWTSDGTAEGTAPIRPGPDGVGSVPFSLTALEGSLYYVAEDGQRGRQLWRVAGPGPAQRLTEIGGQVAPGYDSRGLAVIGTVGTMVLFPASDDHGTELWGFRTR